MADKLTALSAFSQGIPHNRALGLRVVELVRGGEGDPFRGQSIFVLPYDPKLVGNPDTGVLHGGAITALLDGCSGSSVFAALTEWRPIATLDLRIDYLRAAEVGRDVIAKASCYRLAKNVAFTRAIAYHEDAEHDPIASSMGTFMLDTKAGKVAR